jgi:hypothetical protein
MKNDGKYEFYVILMYLWGQKDVILGQFKDILGWY